MQRRRIYTHNTNVYRENDGDCEWRFRFDPFIEEECRRLSTHNTACARMSKLYSFKSGIKYYLVNISQTTAVIYVSLTNNFCLG